MPRRAINQLGDHEPIDQIFLASDKQLRPNRNGNLYLSLRLSDRTGIVMGMMWNASDRVYREFDNGDYVRVEGNTQFYNGALQVIVSHIERISEAEVDEADFVLLGPQDIDRLLTRMAEILRSLTNYHLRNLAECLLTDESLVSRLSQAPAGVKNHHAYRGGLLEHVVALMELSLVVGPRYPKLDTELLVMGCALHDLGKLRELSYDRDFAYTDEGQLLGHVVIAIGMLDELVAQAEKTVRRAPAGRTRAAAETHDRQPPRGVRLRQPQAAHDPRSHRPASPGQPGRQDPQLRQTDGRRRQRRQLLDHLLPQHRPQTLQGRVLNDRLSPRDPAAGPDPGGEADTNTWSQESGPTVPFGRDDGTLTMQGGDGQRVALLHGIPCRTLQEVKNLWTSSPRTCELFRSRHPSERSQPPRSIPCPLPNHPNRIG